MPAAFVLDSSVALSWCFKDEETPESLRILKAAEEATPVVPALWHIEMANILGLALKAGRMTPSELDSILLKLGALEIETSADRISIESRRIVGLMGLYGLTAYDSCYLDLALSSGLPLATFDRKLSLAAQRAGVPLITAPLK